MSQNKLRPRTVLVADDDDFYRSFMRDFLERQGYEVVCAEDGEQALKIVNSRPIDLALLDVIMPDRSGFSVCRQIKYNPATRLIPVVLVTGLDSREDHILGIDCGADDFLNKPVQSEELKARVRSLLRLKQFTDELEDAETVINTLARSIEAKDPYTEGHSERLSHYSVLLAERLGLSEDEILALRRGGIVHDIGKVTVPEHILLKPGPLTAEERHIVERHPEIGERICAPLKSFRLVLPIIRHHHERLDGSGYPDGLRGEQIPLTARIMSVVDIYDAITTERAYRAALSSEDALQQMRHEVERGWWDGSLVDLLEDVLSNPATERHDRNLIRC